MEPILFVQAGGTIDKDYLPGDNHHGYNFIIDEPAFEKILTQAKMNVPHSFSSASKNDSLDHTATDLQAIVQAVTGTPTKQIVVTHGTDAIKKTAEYLSRADVGHKTIVLTGARRPAAFIDTDAHFNLGAAVAAVQCLPPGIYITLHGQIVSWENYHPF